MPKCLCICNCFSVCTKKDCTCAQDFPFASRLCIPLKLEATDASERSWGTVESSSYPHFTATEWNTESECHTSEGIFLLSNPTMKGLSLIIRNMNDSAICGFLKMPPPHVNRPLLQMPPVINWCMSGILSAHVSERSIIWDCCVCAVPAEWYLCCCWVTQQAHEGMKAVLHVQVQVNKDVMRAFFFFE